MIVRKLILACVAVCAVTSGSFGRDDAEGRSVYDVTLNDFATGSLVRDIASVRSECLDAERVYRLDCLRQGLDQVSRRTPYHGEYARMREVLRNGASAIAPIVDANADASRQRLEVRPGTNPRFKSRRRYTAITTARYDTIKAEAFRTLDATQANLLEIGNRSANWNKAYTTMAVAVASLADILRK
jgi:hypothetical protein